MATLGEKKRIVSFNLEHDQERELYHFSQTINFAQLVKRALQLELLKSRLEVGASSLTVEIGGDSL